MKAPTPTSAADILLAIDRDRHDREVAATLALRDLDREPVASFGDAQDQAERREALRRTLECCARDREVVDCAVRHASLSNGWSALVRRALRVGEEP
jgi:hypothetical protein